MIISSSSTWEQYGGVLKWRSIKTLPVVDCALALEGIVNFTRPAVLTTLVLLICSAVVCAQKAKEFPSTSGNAYLRQCSVIEKDDKDQTQEDFRYYVPCIAYTEGVVQGALMESALESAGKGTPHSVFRQRLRTDNWSELL